MKIRKMEKLEMYLHQELGRDDAQDVTISITEPPSGIIVKIKDAKYFVEISSIAEDAVKYHEEIDKVTSLHKTNNFSIQAKVSEAMNEGVHAAHCCKKHAWCKYGEPNCPVVNGLVEQQYPCEQCDEEIKEENEEK